MNPDPIRATPLQTRRQVALLNFLRWAATLILLFVLAISGYYLYVRVINRPPAETYVISRGTAVSAVYGTVTITASYQLSMFAQNSGFLHYAPGLADSAINLNGQIVKNGQLLGTVVDEIGQRQLETAKRDYESAVSRQKVGSASIGPLQAAKAKVEALKKLPKNSLAQIDMDTAVSEQGRLEAAVEAEKLDLQRLVDLAGSTLKISEDQLRRTEVHAPFDGVLTVINYNDNAYVIQNQPLFTVASAATYVSGEVNEEDVGALRPGMKADVRLYSYPNQTFEATLRAVLPTPEANSSRYVVIFDLDHPPDNLLFGLTGEMNVILGKKPNAIIVPARAINIDQAMIVEDGVVEKRTVKIGFKSLEYVEILDGLSEGDQVIVSDQDAFSPGERVRPVKTNQGKPKK